MARSTAAKRTSTVCSKTHRDGLSHEVLNEPPDEHSVSTSAYTVLYDLLASAVQLEVGKGVRACATGKGGDQGRRIQFVGGP